MKMKLELETAEFCLLWSLLFEYSTRYGSPLFKEACAALLQKFKDAEAATRPVARQPV